MLFSRHTCHVATALALTLLAAPACNRAKPPTEKGASGKLSGDYTIADAKNAAGKPYSGSVKIAQDGSYYLVDWTVGESEKYGGVAIERGNVLGVGWAPGGNGYGVVVYKIAGGTLDGLWAMKGEKALGSEKLTGSADLEGEYQIASSYSPQNKAAYRGSVNISRIGDAYKFEWSIDSGESYLGLGVKQGDYLVVAWPKTAAGVVAYQSDGSTLDGIWAQWDGQQGTEKIEKQ